MESLFGVSQNRRLSPQSEDGGGFASLLAERDPRSLLRELISEGIRPGKYLRFVDGGLELRSLLVDGAFQTDVDTLTPCHQRFQSNPDKNTIAKVFDELTIGLFEMRPVMHDPPTLLG